MRILLVEDSVQRLEVLRRVYVAHDLSVAASVAVAQGLLRETHFDLVSLDYDLGEGSFGDEIARTLARLNPPDNTVIVHSMNPEGVSKIKSLLPTVIEIPTAQLERGTALYGRLRSQLLSGQPVDWTFVTTGEWRGSA